jgi:ADP-ribose pyrophosphatase YjhB (NUDIX family)
MVFSAASSDRPKAGDDAAEIGLFDPDNLPSPLAFDHETILHDYFSQPR